MPVTNRLTHNILISNLGKCESSSENSRGLQTKDTHEASETLTNTSILSDRDHTDLHPAVQAVLLG